MDISLRGSVAFAMVAKHGCFACVLTLACIGCKSTPAEKLADRHPKNPFAKEEGAETTDVAKNATPEELSAELSALDSATWAERVEPSLANRDDANLHWRNPALDRILAQRAEDRPDLASALASPNPLVAANAAIVMAHWQTGQPAKKLVASIRDTQLAEGVRCAAAEALGLIQEPSPANDLRGLLQQFSARQLAPATEVQVELVRALARRAAPGDEKWFTAALNDPAWQLRCEGLNAWASASKEDLPAEVVELCRDADPRVRIAALHALTAHCDPRASDALQQALNDATPEVRLAAIAELGVLGSQEAHGMLTKLKNARSELSRAASVAALAAAGMNQEVQAAAKDTSSQVRLAVAQTLGQAAHEGQQVAAQTVVTAHNLVRDSNDEVQRQVMESLSEWPLEQAGPVLLLAIAEGGYAARKAAAAQLAERWPAAAEFPIDAAVESRAHAIAELKRQWTQQFGAINDAAVAAEAQARQLVSLSEDRVRELQGLVASLKEANLPQAARQQAIAALSSVGPQLVTVLEQRAEDEGALPAELYEEVLPGVSATFVILERIHSPDEAQRRAAAAELAVQAATVTLSPLALNRLAELVETENDPNVWRSALTTVAGDPRPAAVRMAYTAIGNSSIEVRRHGCEYLAAHGDRRHAEALLPLLADKDETVVLAAIRALGSVGTLDDPQPLLRLLNSSRKPLRIEAALSLARLHAQQGVVAVERLAADTDAGIRLRTVKAMGEIADPAFLPSLITMLADQIDVQRAAMISLSQIAGSDVIEGEDGMSISDEEKVRRWQVWYRDRLDSPTSAL